MPSPGYIGVSPPDRDPTVADDSVTTAKIQDNAVTGPKIAMTSDAAGDILTYTGTDYVRLGIGTATQVLKVNGGATAVEWAADTVNAGDVVGPGSATNDALVRFDTTTGKLIQNSTAILSDAGTLTATAFSGPITGNVTGNASGTAATVTGATQAAITSVGTLTSFRSTGIDDNSNALAVTIDSSERVGIGGGAPTTMLDVTKSTAGGINTILVKNTDTSNTASESRVMAVAGDNTPKGRAQFLLNIPTLVDWGLGVDGNDAGNFKICQSATVGQTARYTVTRAGAHGFGQTSPSGSIVNIGLPGTGDNSNSVSGLSTLGQAYFVNSDLTFNATQTWDCAIKQVCRLVLTGNVTTFAAPTNQRNGCFYSVTVEQDATGGRTVSWSSTFKWAAATAPVVTTTASAKDIFVFRSDATNMYEVGRQLNVS